MTKCFYLIDSADEKASVISFTNKEITVSTENGGKVNVQVIEFI